MNIIKYPILVLSVLASIPAVSQENKDEKLQDMSDPLAVYTQAGFGISDKGINIKVGQAYDSNKPNTLAMNVIEVKGIGGDLLGIRDNDEPLYKGVDDSIDSLRLRNFQSDLTTGRGRQIDINYDVDNDRLDASYSYVQSLPKFGIVQLYPLGGVGVTVANDYSGEDNGYEIPGTFMVVGMYSKIDITDKIWINYNPMYMHTLSGSSDYKDNYYAEEKDILTHEFTLSYQLNKRSNIRYYANWSENVDFNDGDHRIEYNYQF